MKRKQAEERALELYPMQSDTQGDYVYGERRKAYLQCWDDMHDQPKDETEITNEMFRGGEKKVIR